MAQTQSVTHQWPFPLRGVSEAKSYRMQPEGTAPTMKNCRAYDIVEDDSGDSEDRARGGHRGGLENLDQVTGTVLDVVTYRSQYATDGVYLVVITTDGIWIGEDPATLVKYTTDDFSDDFTANLVDGVKAVGYRDRLYVAMDVSYSAPAADDLPATSSAPAGATAITTWSELYDIRKDLSADYELTADLDEQSDDYWSLSGEDDWLGIGTESNPFTGTFYGNGHTITGLKCETPGNWHQGLFGYCDGADIYDVTLNVAEINGEQRVGTLIGRMDGGSVTNCHVHGDVVSHAQGLRSEVGGLIGYVHGTAASAATITDCSADCQVFGGVNRIGGLVGVIEGNSTISKCFSDGHVFATQANPTSGTVGGLVGASIAGSTISNSYSQVDVKGSVESMGGLIGYTSSTVQYCYSSGIVLSGEDVDDDHVGGLIGKSEGATITDCYWDTEKSYQHDSDGGTGVTTEVMQKLGTYSSWDIAERDSFDPTAASNWWIDDGLGYPRLYHEERYAAPDSDALMGRVWNPRSDKIGHWVLDDGRAQSSPSAMCVHQGRILMGGVSGQDYNWYGSRVDDPNDWAVNRSDPRSAVASNSNLRDSITALVSLGDGFLLIGGSSSVSGIEGSVRNTNAALLSQDTGIKSDTAWASDGTSTVWFSDGRDLYQFSPGGGLDNLTMDAIPQKFGEMSGTFTVSVAWSSLDSGVYVVQENGSKSLGWFYDLRTGGWFPDTFSTTTDKRPERTVYFDSDNVSYCGRLEICVDGYVRRMNRTQGTDADEDVEASVTFQPVRTGGSELEEGMLRSLWVVMDENTGNVDWELLTADTFQGIVGASATISGTFTESGRQRVRRRRVRSACMSIRLSSSNFSSPWAVESVVAEARTAGRQK